MGRAANAPHAMSDAAAITIDIRQKDTVNSERERRSIKSIILRALPALPFRLMPAASLARWCRTLQQFIIANFFGEESRCGRSLAYEGLKRRNARD